jgi:hypothetical protein
MKYVLIGAHLTPDDIGELARALPAGPVTLSAIEVQDDRPLGDRALLVEAASVRGQLTERATFVAIRYGVSVATAAEGEAKCAGRLQRWRELLEQHRGAVELTMKVVASGGGSRPLRGDHPTGAGYLRALHASAGASTVEPAFRAAVEAMIADSLEHAFADMSERVWTETRLKAEEMLAAVEKALGLVAGRFPAPERDRIEQMATDVRAAMETHETPRLKAANAALDDATQELAALVVEQAMAAER